MIFLRRAGTQAIVPCLIASMIAVIAAIAAAGPAASARCHTAAVALRERLESVTEAVIDGRNASVPGSADRAIAWWKVHGSSFGAQVRADSLLRLMADAAHQRKPRTAARLAVEVSVLSFSWCPGAPSVADHLMVVDLAGMTGWLRARGEALDWPSGMQGAVDSLRSGLVARRRAKLASRLQSAIDATASARAGPAGDIGPAIQLLDLVDEIEKVMP